MSLTAVLPHPRPAGDASPYGFTGNRVLPAAGDPGRAEPDRPADRAAASQRVLHRLVVRELGLLAELVGRAPADDAARAGELARHAELVARVLLHHHAVERDRVWPALLPALTGQDGDREAALREAVIAWTDACARIDHQLRDLSTHARQWAVARTVPARDGLAAACRALAAAVAAQVEDEERRLLPLLEHLDPAAWCAIAGSARAGLSRRQKLLLVGLALEDSCARDRERLLAGLRRPTRWTWQVVGRGRYRAAVVRLRGEPPAR